LLVHGNLDDNVPPYNTYLVADALIKANKSFDMLVFPNARHGYGADNYYMMRRRWDYFVTHLKNATPPENFIIKIGADTRR
jgi:dipeptidyl-peptidase 4